MGYAFLDKENLPASLKDKPRWVSCLTITSGFLIITLSAIIVGAIFGYTYCYFEHRGGGKGDGSKLTNYQIVLPYSDTEEARYNRTINGAIMSSLLVSKILNLGHALLDDSVECDLKDQITSTVLPK